MANKEGYIGFQSIDKEGNICQSIQMNGCLFGQRYSNGLLLFKNMENGHCGYLDSRGKTSIYLPAEVKEVHPFRFSHAPFLTTSGMGLLNHKGEVTIAPSYEAITPLDEKWVALRNNGRWALAESGGKVLSDFCYDHLGGYYNTGVLVATQGDSCLLLDKRGDMVGNRRFACIVEEATARRQVPQLFIRETPQEKPQEQPEPSTVPAPQPKKSAPTPTLQSNINRESWKKISKQNPFYNEASKVFSGNLEEEDADNRRMILNYVEHLRTSYTTQDIDFLEQLFSENALIVVGTVVRSAPRTETDYLPRAQVVYNVKSKQQYITRLKQVFKANKQIQVEFSNFRIMRHPTKEGIYGVTLQQRYHSDLYSDDGYLFLLWDFRDETAPKIHVRTWQPTMIDEHTRIPEEAIFNISNFNLQ
ncbi:MAG: WG repeat-containing protein [Bacteroides sp.]|nr:WG repeat-containing protein [Bacteroides sp.]